MTRDQFLVLAAAIKSLYPKDGLFANDQAIDIWFMLLKDLDYDAATSAVMTWSANNKFAPSLAEIRELALEAKNGKEPDWGEGYDAMRKAISKYGYMNEEAALDSLDGITKDTVKRLGWMNICMSENEMSLRANFRDIFQMLAKRKKQDDQTPQFVKDHIEQIAQKNNHSLLNG